MNRSHTILHSQIVSEADLAVAERTIQRNLHNFSRSSANYCNVRNYSSSANYGINSEQTESSSKRQYFRTHTFDNTAKIKKRKLVKPRSHAPLHTPCLSYVIKRRADVHRVQPRQLATHPPVSYLFAKLIVRLRNPGLKLFVCKINFFTLKAQQRVLASKLIRHRTSANKLNANFQLLYLHLEFTT